MDKSDVLTRKRHWRRKSELWVEASRPEQIKTDLLAEVLEGISTKKPSNGHDLATYGYEVRNIVAEGVFSKVKKAEHMPTGKHVAIKCVAKPKDNAEAGRHLIREVLIHATISHGNIARLLEIINIQDEIFIIFPFYSGGTLHDRVMQASRLNENESNAYFRQLISSIQYLHVNGIIHRDLKLCNIIIDANDTIKVCDFGLAHIMLPDGQLDSLCGSPEYASPELISNQKYDPKADIWACGIILYAMLTGKLPFMDSFPPRLYACILSGEYEQPRGISSEGQDLIQRILQRDPLIRAGHEDIFRHAWTNRLDQAQMEFAAKTETKEIQPEELAKLTKFGFLACEIAEFGVLQKPGPIRAVFELSE